MEVIISFALRPLYLQERALGTHWIGAVTDNKKRFKHLRKVKLFLFVPLMDIGGIEVYIHSF